MTCNTISGHSNDSSCDLAGRPQVAVERGVAAAVATLRAGCHAACSECVFHHTNNTPHATPTHALTLENNVWYMAARTSKTSRVTDIRGAAAAVAGASRRRNVTKRSRSSSASTCHLPHMQLIYAHQHTHTLDTLLIVGRSILAVGPRPQQKGPITWNVPCRWLQPRTRSPTSSCDRGCSDRQRRKQASASRRTPSRSRNRGTRPTL